MKKDFPLSQASTLPLLLNPEVKMFAVRVQNIHLHSRQVEIFWKDAGASHEVLWIGTEESKTVADLLKSDQCCAFLLQQAFLAAVVMRRKWHQKLQSKWENH